MRHEAATEPAMFFDFRAPPDLRRGLMIGPLFPIGATWLYITWQLLGQPLHIVPTLLLATLWAAPVAYGVTLIVGYPTLLAMRALDGLTPWTCLFAGPVLGLVLGIPVAGFFDDRGFVTLLAVMGFITSAGFVVGAWSRVKPSAARANVHAVR
jgi:hypothetical protein